MDGAEPIVSPGAKMSGAPRAHIEEILHNEAGNMHDVSLMILFGSAASDRIRPNSDVDIAIAGSTAFSWDRQQEIRIGLSRALRREIDIIDLNASKGLVFYEAMTKGKVITSTNKRMMARLMTDVVYFAADMLPMITRALELRARRFVNG